MTSWEGGPASNCDIGGGVSSAVTSQKEALCQVMISSKTVSLEAALLATADLVPGPWRVLGDAGRDGGPRLQPPSPWPDLRQSDSHLILAGSAEVLGQVMAGDELQLLQRALALEGRPARQRAPTSAGV